MAERPKPGDQPIWFGGGTLATDLRLGQLRQEWPETPTRCMEAAAEWNTAGRNKRKVSNAGPENAARSADVWVECTRNATALDEKLRALPHHDHAAWAKAARVRRADPKRTW